MTNNQEIATTILNQLGGGQFRLMTGAKSFLAIERGLQFRLPSNFAKSGINCIRVTLNVSDLYDMEFGKTTNRIPDSLKGSVLANKVPVYDPMHKVEDVYGDQMAGVFREYTGLDTTMGKIVTQRKSSGPSM